MNPTDDTLARVQHLAAAELSLPSRLGYVGLLLAALTMTCIVSALWVTEPALPRRAQIAFAVMIVIGVSWVVFAVWVLTQRRVLFARDTIVAGRMAVTFTAVFVIGALAVARGRPAAYLAAMLGMVMLGAAVAMLTRAHRKFARLTQRREALERELGRTPRSEIRDPQSAIRDPQ
jgi:hypothetical protein